MKHWNRLPTDTNASLSLDPYVREVNDQGDNFACFQTFALLLYDL